MQNLNAVWLYPIILIAGALQAWGPPMNNALRNSLQNPWLSSVVSFLPIVALLFVVWVCQPHPLPTREGLAAMPWWAPLGGLIGDRRSGGCFAPQPRGNRRQAEETRARLQGETRQGRGEGRRGVIANSTFEVKSR